jgi:hypothetical protein
VGDTAARRPGPLTDAERFTWDCAGFLVRMRVMYQRST